MLISKNFIRHYAAIVSLALACACAVVSCVPDSAHAQIVNPSQPATGVPLAGAGISVSGQTVSINYGLGSQTYTGNFNVGGTLTAGSFSPSSLTTGNLTATGTVSGVGFSNLFAAAYPIGSVTPNTGAFTNLAASGTTTLATVNNSGTVTNSGPTALVGTVSGAGIDSYIANKSIVQTVANVAALRAVNCVPGLLYADQGYYTIGGGGASTYICNGSDTTSADNGVTILASANSNRLYLVQNGPVSVLQAGAKCDGSTDDSVSLNTILANVKNVYVPALSCKATVTLNLPAGVNLSGNGATSSLLIYGANGLTVNGNNVTISNLGIFSYTSGGTADPRSYRGIYAAGVTGTHINSLYVQNIYAQGWSDAAYLAYTWSSKLVGFQTVNTNNGVTLFGQSVNNAIDASTLTVNGGNASILLTPDTGFLGEGLTVTGSVLTSGAYGISSGTGFLSLNVDNCIIDLVSNIGINLTGAQATRISNSWIYATNYGVKLNDLGASQSETASIANNNITVTAASGAQGIYLGALNSNISVTGNSLTYSGTSLGLFSNAGQVSVTGNNFVNNGSGPDIYVNTNVSTHWLSNNTGVTTITGGAQAYYSTGTWAPADASGAGLTFTQNFQANYVKNGRSVIATFDISYPTTANSANASISLPFAPLTGAASACTVGYQSLGASFTAATSSGGVAQLFLYSASATPYTNVNLSGKRFNITCAYIGAS